MSKIIDLKNIVGLEEQDLCKRLQDDVVKNKNLKIIFQHRTVLVFVNNVFEYKGEFLNECVKIIKKSKNILLFKVKKVTNEVEEDFSNIVNIGSIDILEVNSWIKNVKERLDLDKKTIAMIWSNAKEHCQLCGIDLTSHHSTKIKGNYAQIAHIEACGGGQRYNNDLENPNEIENLMLLCYPCHRIIDVINPEKYTSQILKEIKINNEAKVKLLLSSLKYKEATPLRISTRLLGDDYVYATDSHIIDALNQKQLSINSNFLSKTLLTNPLEEKRTPHNSKYWNQFFAIYQKDSAFINDQKNKSSELALFIYHGISDMIFLGSRFGDTVSVNLFQKHRKENDHFNWTWPNEKDMTDSKSLHFSSNIIKDYNKEEEGLLLVTLTADINTDELPSNLYNNGYIIPTIKIESSEKRVTVISKETDLKTVDNLLNESIKNMKDLWKLKKIHIIVIAPTVINFSVGRAIQARYQGNIICYEKNSITGIQEPTICIKDDIVYYVADEDIHLKLNN